MFNLVKEWYYGLYNRINKSRIERKERRFDQCYAFVKRINRIIADKGETSWTHRDYFDYWCYMSEYIGNLAKYKQTLLKSRNRHVIMGNIALLLLPVACATCLLSFSLFVLFIISAILAYDATLIGKELDIIEKHIGFLDLDVAYYGTRKYKNIESEKQLLNIRQNAYGYFGISKDEICQYCVLRLESIINPTSLYPYPSSWTEEPPSKDIIRLYSDDVARDTVDDDLCKNLDYILGGDIDFIDHH